MMYKFVLCGLVVASMVLQAKSDDEDSLYGDNEKIQPCKREGGICIMISECNSDWVVPGNELCWQSRMTCCRGFPIHDRRCSVIGGKCIRKGLCNIDMILDDATQCAAHEDCCQERCLDDEKKK